MLSGAPVGEFIVSVSTYIRQMAKRSIIDPLDSAASLRSGYINTKYVMVSNALPLSPYSVFVTSQTLYYFAVIIKSVCMIR